MACSPLPPPGDCGSVKDTGSGSSHTGLHGELLFPGTVHVLTGRMAFGLCAPGYDYPDSSDVSVTAPSGAALSTSWRRDNRGLLVAELVSPEAGDHRMQVTYTPDPATGREPTTLSTTLVVMRDRSSAARHSIPASCAQLDRTELGAWICDGRVIRDGSVVQELGAGSRFEVDGPSVWEATAEGEIIRWQDTGTGALQRVSSVPASDPTIHVSELIGAGDEVLVRRFRWGENSNTLERWVMPAGGDAPRLAGSLALSGLGDVSRNGDELLVEQYIEGTEPQFRICAYRLEGDAFVPSAAPCLAESAISASAGGLWVQRRHRMDLYRAEDGGVAHVAGIERPDDLLFHATHPELGFTYSTAVYPFPRQTYAIAPVVGAGGATLDAFPLRGDFLGLRRDFVWTSLETDAGVMTEVIFR